MSETNETQFELRLLGTLLKPSYLSGTIAVLSTLLVVGSALLAKAFWTSGWLADTLRTVSDSNTHLLQNRTGDGDSPFNVALLFLFWASVGLAVYFVVIGIARAVAEAKELEREITFVHGDRKKIIRNAVKRLVIRVSALALMFVAIALYLKNLVPYSLTSARDVTASPWSIILVVLAAISLLVMMHLIAVLLRVVALRPRLFTPEI
ncbi:hypothetical protein BH09PAT4_BH09PAT4_02400 [soil metagenome]